jgi:Fe-S-cluster containining protein
VVPIRCDILEKNRHRQQVESEEALQIGSTLIPLTDDDMCVFLNRNTKRCEIYEERPETCRQYGLVPELPCLYIAPSGRSRTPLQIKRAERRLEKNLEKLNEQIAKIPQNMIVHTLNKDSK